MKLDGSIAKKVEDVFVGIDVHVLFSVVTVVIGGAVIKQVRIVAGEANLIMWLLKSFRGREINTVYEAGFCGFGLHRALLSSGIKNIVVNPSSVEVAAGDRVKTDKRDSKKLAIQLSAGRLVGIRIPSEQEEHWRLITRTREQLVRKRKRVMNQIRMKFYQFGISCTAPKKKLTLRAVSKALEGNITHELRISIESLMTVWKTLNSEIRKLQKEMRLQAGKDPRENVYRKVLWVGPITARILSNELGDLQQFPNTRCAYSFTGLTPQEFTSAEHRRLGHISRQGSSRLRHILVEAAWRAIKKDSALNANFNQIAARAGKKRAIVAVARKLVGRLRAAFRKGDLYQIELKAA